MSNKQTECQTVSTRCLHHRQDCDVITRWFSKCLDDGECHSLPHSLDFCEPETRRCLCQCWCWTNFLMATWEMRESQSTKEEGFTKKKQLQLRSWRFLTGQPAFQRKLRGWVTGPRAELGRRQVRQQDSAESPPRPDKIQKDSKQQILAEPWNIPACLCTCSNKGQIVSTHRGAVCVGQRERNSLGGVDHRGPGQLRCYFRLHVFLKIRVDFKDRLDPSVRKHNTLWRLWGRVQQHRLISETRCAYWCPECSFSSFHRLRSFWWRSTSASQISSCSASPWGLDSAVRAIKKGLIYLKKGWLKWLKGFTLLAKNLTFKHKWQPHITVITTLQAGVKINICHLKKMEERK